MAQSTKKIIPPKDGWEAHTWYRGECSMNAHNPIFKVLIFSGFLSYKDKQPENYHGVFAENYAPFPHDGDEVWHIKDCRYLKVTEKLFTTK